MPHPVWLALPMIAPAFAPTPELDALLADLAPDVAKWASVVLVGDDGGRPTFAWHHLRDSADAVGFWPASTIKIYAALAALETLNDFGMPTDCILSFERRTEGRWILDAARTMREMTTEVFRRSSNEDYTLLLRFVGIDRINTRFLIPERGFPHSALMRGYVLERPYVYVREEPQRITLRAPDGKTAVVEHTWSGTSYAKARGATIFSETTGNCTSTRELAECLRRIIFHEHLPPDERYRLTDAQVRFIREGGDGLVGLENREAGPYAWEGAGKVFPKARFFHKGGWIESYTLDAAYIDDPDSKTRLILALATATGKTEVAKEMARRIAEWAKRRGADPRPAADLVLRGGIIRTVDPDRPTAQAIAIRGDTIVAVGSADDIAPWIGPRTRAIDTTGLAVYPAFIDAHAHMEGLGASFRELDLVGTESADAIAALVRIRATRTPAGEWIIGRGWDQNDWKETSFPTRRILDAVAPDHPVWLTRIDGHAGWANGRALMRAGIGKETPDPPGGRIHRDPATGEPTGILIDGAMGLVASRIPPPSRAERKDRLRDAVRACIAAGLAGVHDAGVDATAIDLYKELIDEGAFPFRVYAMVSGSPATMAETAFRKGPVIDYGGRRLTIRAVKQVADGALGSRGAALLADYADDPGNRGLLFTDRPALEAIAKTCLASGWQLAMHAIGDRANRVVLDAVEAALRAASTADPRFRIEHAQVLAPEDIPRLAKLGVIASVQPTHATSDMPWAEARLGAARIRGAYAWRSLLASGARIASGSDFPVESHKPLWGIYAAVTRQDRDGRPEGGWMAEERMTREEALRSFTIDAAYAAFEETWRGSVTPGKVADLAVLDRDILTVPASEIPDAKVRMTIVGGEIVHEAPADGPHRNVLLIAADDLNADLGCYGHPIVKSPHIDRLAARGVRFLNAYCQYPVCNPSRSSFLTGLYPDRTGVLTNAGDFRKKLPDVTTLPQLFQRQGYYVARVGKIFHYGVPDQIGTPGKDDPASWHETVNPRGIDREVHDRIQSLQSGQFGGTLSWLRLESEDSAHTDAIGASAAISLLEANHPKKTGKPFFLAVGFYRPHTPFVAPSKYFDLYPLESIEPELERPGDRDDIPVAALADRPKQRELTVDQRKAIIQAYYASISFMDAQVGRLLDSLDRLGLADSTAIVFLSDNGYQLGRHGLWQKGDLFEGSCRVPLIIVEPGAPNAGKATKAIVEFVDIYPTLAEICGLDRPARLAGESLVPILRDPNRSGKPAALTQAWSRAGSMHPELRGKQILGYTIRTPRHRYTEWGDGAYGTELYDYEKDPEERKNLAGDPAHRDTVTRMKSLLDEARRRAVAP